MAVFQKREARWNMSARAEFDPFPDHAITQFCFWWSHAIRTSFSLRKKSWNNWKIKLKRQESGLNEQHLTLIILITALPLYIIHRLHSTLITTTHVTLIGIHGKSESFVQDFPLWKERVSLSLFYKKPPKVKFNLFHKLIHLQTSNFHSTECRDTRPGRYVVS